MKKYVLQLCLAAAFAAAPAIAFAAAEFGLIDTAKVREGSTEIQKTHKSLENQKDKLQKELEAKRDRLKKLDDEYVSVAKQIQELRDKKKDKEAQNLEGKLKELRQKLAKETSEVQRFFEESQKGLYALERKELSSLHKSIDSRLDSVIAEIAKRNKLKAVFEKAFCFYTDPSVVKDITEEVIKKLNGSATAPKSKK